MRHDVVVTGIGVINAAVTGASPALGAWLARPHPLAAGGVPSDVGLPDHRLAGLIDPAEARRLSRICQMTIAAARLALSESGVDPARGLGLVVGSGLGDFTSTIGFADGYLARGAAGLSPLLFPSTVMNTMAATTAIAVGAREMTLTISVPTIAGELAIARGTAAVASGRVPAVLAGGVDALEPLVSEMLRVLGDGARRGEGAAFLVLETEEAARARGVAIHARITGTAWRALAAAPSGVGRATRSRAIGAAIERAGGAAPGWLYASASGDGRRDAWECRVLAAALGTIPPSVSLAPLLGHHAGLGALHVAAAAWTARSGLLPRVDGGTPVRVTGEGLVHGLARGGGHVALVVGDATVRAATAAGTGRP
jgi:3-oxoacyl-[acyl-carrier-protein] synthase II